MSLIETFMELDKFYDEMENEPAEDKSQVFLIMKQNYDTSVVFKDRKEQSGEIADLINDLESNNIPYDQYIHKTGKGITIFHDKF
jgi:hypothetical protein